MRKGEKERKEPVRKEKWTPADQKMLENLVAKRMRVLPVLGQEIIDLVNAAQEPPKAKAAGSAA